MRPYVCGSELLNRNRRVRIGPVPVAQIRGVENIGKRVRKQTTSCELAEQELVIGDCAYYSLHVKSMS